MGRIVLDLHDVFDDDEGIESALNSAINKAVDKKIRMVEIIPGKGSGQLRKRVIRFLQQPHIKSLYHRFEIDEKNHGKMYVHFKV